MKKTIFILFLPLMSYAESYNASCTGTQNAPALTAYNYMKDRLSISAKDIDNSKTRVKLVDRQPLTKLMGEMIIEQKMKEPHSVSEEQWRKILNDIYIRMEVVEITIKVRFMNYAGKENSFIVTSYIDDGECSIGDGGMIMLNRGF